MTKYMQIEKLKWHSRRSTLELDLFFDRFLQNNGLDKLSHSELFAYQTILEYEDSELSLLLLGDCKLEDQNLQSMIDKIRNGKTLY